MQDVDEALLKDAGEEEMSGAYSGFTMPYEVFSRINPENIGIVEVMARKDAKPEHIPGELELRFRPEDIMLLQDRPTVLQETRHTRRDNPVSPVKIASYDELLMVYTGEGTLNVPISMTGRPDFSDLDLRARKAYAWVLSKCKFAQAREQQYLPFYDPKEYKPIPEDDVNWPDPSANPLQALEEMVNERPKEVREFLKVHANIYAVDDVSFEDAGSQQKADPVVVVEVANKRYVVEDLESGYGTITEAREWVNQLADHELGNYVGYRDFNADFWNDADGLILYHATDPKNVRSILRKGLSPSSRTRALSNRGMGSAVFSSPSPEAVSSYGDAVFSINVGAMKADGYMPQVSQEEPFEDEEMRSALAYKIGIDYEVSSEYYSEGLSEDTVAFFDTIPPKYLRLESELSTE
jgi:hypothetical protein